jgi:hypothetical protein
LSTVIRGTKLWNLGMALSWRALAFLAYSLWA